jgi:hypothetical protein
MKGVQPVSPAPMRVLVSGWRVWHLGDCGFHTCRVIGNCVVNVQGIVLASTFRSFHALRAFGSLISPLFGVVYILI